MIVRLTGGGSIGFGGKEYAADPAATGKKKDLIELPDSARADMVSHGIEIVTEPVESDAPAP